MTQAQKILFEVMNKGAIANNSTPIDEQSFIDILSDKESKAHAFAMAQLEAMEVYGEAKWNEACDTVRENVSGNILIENDFLSLYLNPEFRP